MVKTATNLGRSGLQDWLMQRVSALILIVYLGVLLGFFWMASPIDYAKWHAFCTFSAIQYASLLVLLALIAHAWIGIWTIMTDYIKSVPLRLFMQMIVFLSLLIDFFWGIRIIWGA